MSSPNDAPPQQASEPKGPVRADTPHRDLAIVLSGGGARAAYQVGVLRGLGRRFPDLRFPIITGVSAGAINAVFLASHRKGLGEAAQDLAEVWHDLRLKDVFRVDTKAMAASFLRWVTRLGTGGSAVAPKVRGLVDSAPLRQLLHRILGSVDGEIQGIGHNIHAELLKAVALTTVDYDTGQTVTWVEGADFDPWQRPHRLSRRVLLTAEHVMASAALPLLFPAVRLGPHWHGDGGIRLAAPLAPSIHLGANRILVISTRYDRTQAEADRSTLQGYPPPAQILGKLLNSVFLDVIDQDVAQLRHLNELIARVPVEERKEFRKIDALVLRPSKDLGRISAGFEPDLPRAFRYLTRSLGTRETSSPDFLSLLMFEPGYLRTLLEIGEEDAETRGDEVAELLAHSVEA